MTRAVTLPPVQPVFARAGSAFPVLECLEKKLGLDGTQIEECVLAVKLQGSGRGASEYLFSARGVVVERGPGRTEPAQRLAHCSDLERQRCFSHTLRSFGLVAENVGDAGSVDGGHG